MIVSGIGKGLCHCVLCHAKSNRKQMKIYNINGDTSFSYHFYTNQTVHDVQGMFLEGPKFQDLEEI